MLVNPSMCSNEVVRGLHRLISSHPVFKYLCLGAATSVVTDERRGEGEDLRRDDLIRKSKDLVQGWSHTKEYNKK